VALQKGSEVGQEESHEAFEKEEKKHLGEHHPPVISTLQHSGEYHTAIYPTPPQFVVDMYEY